MVYSWQQAQWDQLRQARESGRLHHALLFYGQQGTGKAGFAHEIARGMLCKTPRQGEACGSCSACRLLAAGTHPDFIMIRPQPPRDSKSANPVLSIKVEVIRDLCERLGTTSQLGGYRVALIEGADRMNIASANSLLKTLEEPGADTLILLVSSRPHRLPVTIRSRCQQLAFPVPPKCLAVGWLQEQGIANAEEKLAHSHGAPLPAAAGDTAGESRTLLDKALAARTTRQSSLQFAAGLAGFPRAETLAMLLDRIAELVRVKAGSTVTPGRAGVGEAITAIARDADWRRIFSLYDETCRLLRYDAVALNNELLWENLLISWDRL